MKCMCGCGVEVKEGNKYINHHHKPNLGKPLTLAHKLELSLSLKNRTFSEEHLKNLSIHHADVNNNKNPMYGRKGKYHPMFGKHFSLDARRKMSESRKGKKAYQYREDISREKILSTLEDLISNNKKWKKTDLWVALCSRLKCSGSPIGRFFTNITDMLEQANIVLEPVDRRLFWPEKEKLGLELCKELYGEGKVKPYYKGIGRPDYVPNDSTKPIIEIKSSLMDIREEQILRYLRVRETKIMIFDNKGKLPIEENRIIYMQEIIKNLPNDKSIVFQHKIENIIKESEAK